jgi:AcrR family transcriptional regulator
MASPTTATTRRGTARREQILAAAADLMAERGFHAVGVTDIGALIGVTGAALYRHFESKPALLVAIFDRAVDGLLGDAEGLTADGRPATIELLGDLVAAHLDFALRDRSVLAVYAREHHNMPPDDLRRLRRNQRRYVDVWIRVLVGAFPTIDDRQALARVEATFGLLNSVPNVSSTLTDDELRVEFSTIAIAALTAPPSPPRSSAVCFEQNR